MNHSKLLIIPVAALCLLLPAGAQAQDQDQDQDQNRPSYAAQAVNADENIHGRITTFDGGYNLSVRDERGYLDNVRLHPGTIINPTGLSLTPGMIVSVLGYNGGSYFAANQIDTPYELYGAVPYYSGHPWDYYGPSISLGFFFGNPGWWHGGYFHGGYHYAGGARVYEDVRVNEFYRGHPGVYHGRDYVAPPEHGGYYGHDGRDGHDSRDQHDGHDRHDQPNGHGQHDEHDRPSR